MAPTNLISFSQVQLAFGHHPLLDHADFSIQSDERIGLIGRNGAGKSSLLRLLDGRAVPDDGDIARRSGLRVATVEQEPELDEALTVFEVICGDAMEEEDWMRPSRANAVIEKLGLNADAPIAGLSGGTRKRVALARALVSEPDLLLLDEPTNHLDFEGIAWLESMLLSWRGAAVIITHDRRFLDAVATRIVELDRGRLLSFPGNFSQWQVRKAQWLESERLEQARFDKLLAQEEVWIRKGVEARRTRNEGRVRRLEQLRVQRAERRERLGNVSLAVAQGSKSGKLVAELDNISKRFGDKLVVRDYSTTIFRGDRIGLIGPNGAGKTTLLKLILGQLEPDTGTTRIGTNVTVAYFDQMRGQLDENATLVDVISPGSEWVEIGGERKHVKSYLGDFLFSPARANSPVSSLSGGERARLLLARLFARPANVLVLDEPTNDLDIETLELLEQLLQDYAGTVLLVSHDRTFLDNVVTQTIAYEGNGQWHDYVGGYDDWLLQRRTPAAPDASAKAAAGAASTSHSGSTSKSTSASGLNSASHTEADANSEAAPGSASASNSGASMRPGSANSQDAGSGITTPTATSGTAAHTPSSGAQPAGASQTAPAAPASEKPKSGKSKLAPWEQKSLDEIPEQIARIEAQQAELTTRLADGTLYRDAPEEVEQINSSLAKLQQQLDDLFEKWEKLEAKRGTA